MKPVAQEDGLGCAVACVAFILKISYQKAIDFFIDGRIRAKEKANFYCPEIVKILKNNGVQYKWRKIKDNIKDQSFQDKSIVFIEKSKKFQFGHFVCRYNNQWMDPWKNLPNNPIKAGFVESLQGKPTYVIYPVEATLEILKN